MNGEIPQSKWKRSVVTGKTAAAVGGKVFKYLAKKPFLSEEKRHDEKKNLESDSARTIFKALVLLKGTALKIAQALSMESGLIPDEIRAELEKSYNQVPPMNRVLVRKAVSMAFSQPPESVFSGFDLKAIAAASLGQVHLAKGPNDETLAVKVQYPGISKTIKSDMQMIKGLLRPLPEFHQILPSLQEIENRLFEETDYTSEADNIRFFKKSVNIEGVTIPNVFDDLSTKTVLTTEFIEGLTVDQWIKTDPDQVDRNMIAATLYRIFIEGFYDHRCIHADPNPGNYIVTDDLKTGLVDFGCVKRFSPEFVNHHKQLIHIIIHKKKEEYIPILEKLNLLSTEMNPTDKDIVYDLIFKVMDWYSALYENTWFDFGSSSTFLNQGKELMQEFYNYKKNFSPNAEFVFLDRTRYGLFRLFESMGARVKMINSYEC